VFTELLASFVADSPSTVVAAAVTADSIEIEVVGAEGPDGDTVFQIASVTKVFTVMTAVSVDATHELSLDDPASQYWTGAPGDISLRSLTNHSSGLKRLPPSMNYIWLRRHKDDPYPAYDRNLLAEDLVDTPRKKPGKVRYSNYGMGLLGETLAVATGRSFSTLVQDHVLDPLGLENTTFAGEPIQPYSRRGKPENVWTWEAMAGAGALRSTAKDMARFCQYWMDPQPPFDRMFTDALGWQVLEKEDGPVYWHNGAVAGSASFVAVDPERDLAVVILTNRADPWLKVTRSGLMAMARLQSRT